MTLQDDIRKGSKAEELLRNPLLKYSFDEVREDLQRMIETSDFAQNKEREEAYHMLRALQAVRGKIESVVRKGKSSADKANENPFRRVTET